jgi:hypothetical protein
MVTPSLIADARTTPRQAILAVGATATFIKSQRAGRRSRRLRSTFSNKGISGNRIYDLEERLEKDVLALKPNLVSILIGITTLGAATIPT